MSKLDNWNVKYFDSGEYQVVEERLNDLGKQGVRVCPARKDMFKALHLSKPETVRVAIFGQDPYPTVGDATGVAFAVPSDRRLPPTLRNIFEEYSRDLLYPRPTSGDLSAWVRQGVLLWNVYPSCTEGHPGSHHWEEWTWLTREIVEKLDGKVIFIILGSVADRVVRDCIRHSQFIKTSHPSPLGASHGFIGSGIFSH